MEKLMAVLITGLLYMSRTDSMKVSGDAGRDNTEDVSVRLMITVPASTAYVRTRETFATTDHGSKINEIRVLAFEEGRYEYRIPSISIDNTSSVTPFKALLKSSSSPLKLLTLTSATDAVVTSKPLMDDSEDLVKKNINLRFNDITSGFPMYGEHRLPGELKATVINNITGIKMLCSTARVDVKATEVANFKLSGVKAYRASDRLQITPDETGVVRVTLPSVPVGNTGSVNSVLYPVPAENLNEFPAQLYLPEADSPAPDNRVSRATCIVVEGYYEGNDQPSYYRMDFDPSNVEDTFGQVLRDHKYIFDIKKVSGPGWGSSDGAANNRSAHIVVEVQVWDDYTIDMSFDEEHHFGVSSREIILRNKAGSAGIISMNTNLPNYTLQWINASEAPQGATNQSLTSEFFKVERTRSGSQLMITVLQNSSASNVRRTRNFVITARRWRILVSIQQRYDVTVYKTINPLTFDTGLGYLGTNIIGSDSVRTHATSLHGVLNNQDNSGPAGTVGCGGYNLIGVSASNNNLADTLSAAFDVVYVHYMSDSLFEISDAQKARNRMGAKKNRVLIVSHSASDVSRNLLKEILSGNSGISFTRSNTRAFPLTNPMNNDHYFTSIDPFTSGSYTPVSTSFSLRNYGSFHGEVLLNTDASKSVTPMLVGSSGGIVLGIDYSRRIVYWSDTDIDNSGTSTGGTANNCINNDNGTISNDTSKLIVNVFAWIAEAVLCGE